MWPYRYLPPVTDHDLAAIRRRCSAQNSDQVPSVKGIDSWRVTAAPAVVSDIPSSSLQLLPRPYPEVRIACPGQARCCGGGP